MGPDEGGGEGEEWKDDGWGTFEALEESKSIPSSGADFFDTFNETSQKKRAEKEDLFEKFGVGQTGGRERHKASPPPVSSSLFGGHGSGGGEGGGGGDARDEGGGDWGDWSNDFSSPKRVCYELVCPLWLVCVGAAPGY